MTRATATALLEDLNIHDVASAGQRLQLAVMLDWIAVLEDYARRRRLSARAAKNLARELAWSDPDGVETLLTFHGESRHAHAPARALSKSTTGVPDIIYAGHSPLHLRRGTTHLDVQATAWQVSLPSMDPGRVVMAVFDSGWNYIASQSTTVDLADTLTDNPLDPVKNICVPVTADGAPLTQDLWCYLVVGLKIEELSNYDITMLLQDMLAWECQLPAQA